MAAIDPKTKVFTDPRAAIKKELEQVSANKTIANKERLWNLTEPPERRDREQKVHEAAFGGPVSPHSNQSQLVDHRPVEKGV